MSRKIPEHLRPLYDELTVTFNNGKFSNEVGQTYKTAKEAIEHNQQIDKYISSFDFKPTQTKPFRERVKAKPKPKQQSLNLDLNFYDEINKIRSGLNNIKQHSQPPATVKAKTSSGLNYIMGYDDE